MAQAGRGTMGWLAVVVALLATGCHDPGTKRGLGAFAASPDPLEFGPVALGRERVLELDLTNRGVVPYMVYEIVPTVPNVEVVGFEPVRLESGASHRIRVRFSPSVEGKVTGAVSIRTDEAEAPVAVPLVGVGVRAFAQVQARSLDFGPVDLGTAKVLTLEVENPTQVETELQLTIGGEQGEAFSSAEADVTLVLEPGEKRNIPVAFRPQTFGVAEGYLKLNVCDGCEQVTVNLTGEGIANLLEIFPSRVSFGRVALGATASQKVTITNHGTEPVPFKGARIVNDKSGGAFDVAAAPQTIPQGGSAELEVFFTPAAAGPVSAHLEVDVIAGNVVAKPKLEVKGEGGASCIAVIPKALDFGMVPEGMSATRRVDLFNRCTHDVQVIDTQLSTQQGGYFSMAQMVTTLMVPAGKVEAVRVTFTPKPGAPQSEGLLTLKIAELNALSTEQVSLTGASKVFAPCTWDLLPAALEFGAVPVGSEVTLGVSLRNSGSDECFVGTVQLASGTDPEFTAVPVQSTTLLPGEQVGLKITFKPSLVGSFAGLAEGWVNHPTNNHPTAMISGTGVQGCFALQPTQLEYGTLKLSCGPKTKSVTAFNTCSAPVLMQQGVLDTPGTGDFVILAQPAANTTLSPNQQGKFDVRYQPAAEGEDVGALRVTADGVVYTAGLSGSALHNPTQTDRYAQETKTKVDILFVIDNSGSMMEEQTSLGQNFAAFISGAQQSSVDWQLAVTTTGIQASPGGWAVCPGGAEGGEAGRLFPVNGSSPRILTPATPNVAQLFAQNVAVGVCHWDEQGLEAAYRALSPPLVHGADHPGTAAANDGNLGFLREEAKLAIIIVSDEEDFSPQPVTFYETFFKALKGNDPNMLTVSAIVSPANLGTCPTGVSSGNRYIQLANATGGVVDSICTQNWAASLADLSETIYGPARRFPLKNTPGDPSQIEVLVNGLPVTTGWQYDAGTNAIVFEESATPPAGSSIEITYPLGC